MINSQNFENKGIILGCHIRSIYSISWAGSFIATGASDNRICVFELNKEDLKGEEAFRYNVVAM